MQRWYFSGGETSTAAQEEQTRAMKAASEATGSSSEQIKESINLPGGSTLGACGIKERSPCIMVSL